MSEIIINAKQRSVKIDNQNLGECTTLRIENSTTQHLEYLELTNIVHLKNPNKIRKTEILRVLKMNNVEIVQDFSFIGELDYLEELHLTQLPTLTDISWLSKLTNLKVLVIEDCSVGDLSPVLRCVGLQQFNDEEFKSIPNTSCLG